MGNNNSKQNGRNPSPSEILSKFLIFFKQNYHFEGLIRVISPKKISNMEGFQSSMTRGSDKAISKCDKKIELDCGYQTISTSYSSGSFNHEIEYFMLIATIKNEKFSLLTFKSNDERIDLIETQYYEHILDIWKNWDYDSPVTPKIKKADRRCYLNLLDCEEDYAMLQPGDIVAYWNTRCLTLISFHHYAIYIGNDEFIHFDGVSKKDAMICKTNWNTLQKDKKYFFIVQSKTITSEMRIECVKRAKGMLKEFEDNMNTYNSAIKYNALERNCENFAKYCLFGSDGTSTEVLSITFDINGNILKGVFDVVVSILSIIWDAGCLLAISDGLITMTASLSIFEPILALIGLLTCFIHIPKRIYNYYKANGKFPSWKDMKKILKLHFSLNIFSILLYLGILVISVSLIVLFFTTPALPLTIGAGISIGVTIVGIIMASAAIFGKNFCRRVISKFRDDPPKSLLPEIDRLNDEPDYFYKYLCVHLDFHEARDEFVELFPTSGTININNALIECEKLQASKNLCQAISIIIEQAS